MECIRLLDTIYISSPTYIQCIVLLVYQENLIMDFFDQSRTLPHVGLNLISVAINYFKIIDICWLTVFGQPHTFVPLEDMLVTSQNHSPRDIGIKVL